MLFRSVCLPPTTGSIEHCLAYRAPGECVRCAEGYIPRRDFAFCQPQSSVNGACTVTDKVGTMQTFKQTDCDNYATPGALNFTPIGCLEDERDGKLYEVRKFADGKCWMVDNLAYGGATAQGGSDACAQREEFISDGYYAPSNRFGAGSYGDCRDPAKQGNSSYSNYCAGRCGYLYNLAAALQLPSAIMGENIVYPTGQAPTITSNSVRGLCPAGWHVPSGGESGSESEFIALDLANGGNGNPNSAEGRSLYQLFWQHNKIGRAHV